MSALPSLPGSAGPKRWDVVVFRYPEEPEVSYIKRLVGLPGEELRVYFGHIIGNAMLPMVTMLGVQISTILGGSVVVETVFGWPGLGRLTYDALVARDVNLLLGILFLSSVLVIVTNLLVDLLYSMLDPRIEVAGS